MSGDLKSVFVICCHCRSRNLKDSSFSDLEDLMYRLPVSISHNLLAINTAVSWSQSSTQVPLCRPKAGDHRAGAQGNDYLLMVCVDVGAWKKAHKIWYKSLRIICPLNTSCVRYLPLQRICPVFVSLMPVMSQVIGLLNWLKIFPIWILKSALLQDVAAACFAVLPAYVSRPGNTIGSLRFLATISVLASSVMMWLILSSMTFYTKTELEKDQNIINVLVQSLARSFWTRVHIDVGFVVLCACSYVVAFGQHSKALLWNDCSLRGSDEIRWQLHIRNLLKFEIYTTRSTFLPHY